MQGLCHFISISSKSPTKLEVTSRHDHSRAFIDISDHINVSIKMSGDIDIDIENVDIDILELGVTPVLEVASLTTNTLKKYLSF